MRYRITCVTPTLVGDGQKLAPIDYMVWKDHVNVLDQRRIFKLLAKGPRLDGYLAQLKKAEKLDFASWGGFAQNFAGRRIPFEHASSIPYWEKARAENLFIPTFAVSLAGPYIPGTALKGALRTGAVFDRWTEGSMRDLAARLAQEDRTPRNPAMKAEEQALGGASQNRMRRVSAGDSAAGTYQGMRVYLIRVSTLVARGADRFELQWKRPGGSVESRRIEDSTPIFAEMATPGTAFEGAWQEKSAGDRAKIFQAANRYAAASISRHKKYAEWSGMNALARSVAALEAKLAEVAGRENACLVSMGWGGGMLGKSAYLETGDESYRTILKSFPMYQKAMQTGLPFPKTRRIIFEGGKPSNVAGWVLVEAE